MGERETFLNNIAHKLSRPRKKEVDKPHWSFQPQWEIYKDKSKEDLVEMLQLQCNKIHTTFIRVSSSKLERTLRELFEVYGGGPIITHQDKRYEKYGLFQLLKEQNVYTLSGNDRNEAINSAEAANIGISFSDITLAESGTVTLFHEKSHSRSMTVLPKHFIALIPSETIVPRMSYAMKIIREHIQNGKLVPSCISFITGPSNSADIELNLVVGVHGPVKATYIVIDE